MKRLAALIIDDERLARVSLRKKLSVFPEVEIIGEATSITSAIDAITLLNPDLLFLDIQLSDGTGFDLLDQVDYSGKIVFITAYDEYALRAFEVNAVDYLMKPISVSRLKNLMTKIHSDNEPKVQSSIQNLAYEDRIMVEQKGNMHFLFIKEVIIINSAKDYTILSCTKGRSFIVLNTMNSWEQKLPKEHFFRVRRSAIINLNMIENTIRVGPTAEVLLKEYPEPVKISRNYYKILRENYFYK